MSSHDPDKGHDQRQYERMMATIDAYEGGRLPVDLLIANLEGLLGHLEEVEPEWRRAFEHEWGKLEDAYAFALDEGTGIGPEGQALIVTAIARLKELIALGLSGGADPRSPT